MIRIECRFEDDTDLLLFRLANQVSEPVTRVRAWRPHMMEGRRLVFCERC